MDTITLIKRGIRTAFMFAAATLKICFAIALAKFTRVNLYWIQGDKIMIKLTILVQENNLDDGSQDEPLTPLASALSNLEYDGFTIIESKEENI